jgi:hypothetical protein
MNKSLPRSDGVAHFLMIDLHICMEKKTHMQHGKKEGRLIEFSLLDCVMGYHPHDKIIFLFIFVLFD